MAVSVTSTTACPFGKDALRHDLPLPAGPDIIDIRTSRQSLLHNLDSKVLEGLSQPRGSKYLPSLLLWGESGQVLYDDILASPEYYPYRVEDDLLQQEVESIAQTVASTRTDLLIELGAGNMTKTAQFLSALDKHLSTPLVYFALDVDHALLERSLRALKQRASFRHIQVRALLGTYDDSANWLASPEAAAYRRTLVFLGSSICNDEQDAAINFLSSFARAPETGVPQNVAGFLLAVDGCQDAAKIEAAYDVPGGYSRRWVRQALGYASNLLSGGDDNSEVDRFFDDNNWRFEGKWLPERQRFQTYLTPTRSLTARIRGQSITLVEGEGLPIISSGKWARETVESVCLQSGLNIETAWKNPQFDYNIYWLQPSLKRVDSGIVIMDEFEEGVDGGHVKE
ncbi:histidine-specific methyltransferase [Triangularia verruculosa]|uniref:Histidine-specific methyltransferase n=1 Tax=Triangularia verruculosa TaxID=2587418 RepID=A0AAN7ASM5_9PEZI|nr:histidine-specific methyltransferase [Triangularia verruculosa]